jgi:LSD1 subclass zinc finger protein
MPFIIQCPYDGCRKFMLLEDGARGTTVECLLCKHPIKVDASASGSQGVGIAGGAGGQAQSKPQNATAPPQRQPAATTGARPGAPPMPQAATPPAAKPAQQQKIVNCGKCNTPLKLPPQAKAIKCPRCGNVFNV